MSATDASRNTALLHHFHSAANSRDLDAISKAIDEFFTPDVLFHAPVPNGLTGPEAMKQVWRTLLRAYPDINVTIEETIAEGDRVVSRNTVTGTHLGEYQGLQPTGKTVTYSEMFIMRFTDEGRVAEVRGIVDVLTQLRQLGAFPSP
ncbi:ester cyclase [Streptomyces kanamyceticus]|uniref:Ester cyclase n=1 Tax=Streptomyces kanamyceticus TaxID=1967 RepID=A0A5J6GCZ3_STRKN|nr:ester cyclase [Streptomyces kanamyceticus]QEU93033.1 ester cyclase [Streptomyces kanamyceticus]